MKLLDLNDHFLALIRQARSDSGMKWLRFTKLTGMSRGLFHLWGKTRKARPQMLAKVCLAMNRLPEDLGLPTPTCRALRAEFGSWQPDRGTRHPLDDFFKAGSLARPAASQPPSEPAPVPRTSELDHLPKVPLSWTDRPRAMADLKGQVLRALERSNNAGGVQVVTVRGIGGIGKSTLVAKLAHDPEVLGKFGAVLWLSLGQPHPPDLKGPPLREWLREKVTVWPPVGDGPPPEAPLERALAEYARAVRGRPLLQILDDIWQASHAKLLRVGNDQGVLMVVTREQHVAEELGGEHFLGQMEPGEAVQLFAERASDVALDHPAEVLRLANTVEGHPLAMDVAGRLVGAQRPSGRAVELLYQLQDPEALLNKPAFTDPTLESAFERATIRGVLQKSTDLLPDRARYAFCLLGGLAEKPAVFDGDTAHDLWVDCDGWTEEETVATCDLLESHGLIEAVEDPDDPDQPLYTMHAMLLALARALTASEEDAP